MEPMQIVNLTGGLPERGHIKIGGLGETRKGKSGRDYQMPVKYDHFVITTMVRDDSGNFEADVPLMESIADRTGQHADSLTSIPIRLLYDDVALNLGTRYAAYAKPGRAFCSGNGETAQERQGDGSYRERACPCDRIKPDHEHKPTDPKCKLGAILTVEIEGAKSIGGVWKFRTTSWNTTRAMLGQLSYYRTLTGGPLAGLPLVMRVGPKQVTVDEKQQTIQMVTLEFPGTTDQLRDAGYEIALRRTHAGLRMDHVEATARGMLALPGVSQDFPGETGESLAEYYPHVAGDDQEAVAESGSAGGLEPPAQADAEAQAGAAPAHGSAAAFPPGETVPITVVAPRPGEPEPPMATEEQIAELRRAASGSAIYKMCQRVGVATPEDLYEPQILAALHNIAVKRDAKGGT